MKQTTFGAVGINQNFAIGTLSGWDETKFYPDEYWRNKIDDARYIEIGKNGAYIPKLDMVVFIESK